MPTLHAPKKRRRWIGWLVAAVVTLSLLIAALIIVDNLARDYATTYIRERIVELLKAGPDQAVDVELGGDSVLAQALSGSIDEVRVSVDELSFGELTGALELTAKRVPLDTTKPVGELRAMFSVNEQNVAKLASYLSGQELASITLQEPEIRILSEFSFFGLVAVPVGVGLTPSAVDGQILFEPTSVTLNDADISVDELRTGPFAGVSGTFLASRAFCVAQYLPQALIVDDVDVIGKKLVVSINADGIALADPALSTMGTCPPVQ